MASSGCRKLRLVEPEFLENDVVSFDARSAQTTLDVMQHRCWAADEIPVVGPDKSLLHLFNGKTVMDGAFPES